MAPENHYMCHVEKLDFVKNLVKLPWLPRFWCGASLGTGYMVWKFCATMLLYKREETDWLLLKLISFPESRDPHDVSADILPHLL